MQTHPFLGESRRRGSSHNENHKQFTAAESWQQRSWRQRSRQQEVAAEVTAAEVAVDVTAADVTAADAAAAEVTAADARIEWTELALACARPKVLQKSPKLQKQLLFIEVLSEINLLVGS